MSPRGFLFVFCVSLAGVSSLSVSAEETGDSEDTAAKQSLYFEMKPAFVANAGASTGRQSFVKVEVTLRVSSKPAEKAVEEHNPRLRHEMIMLLADRDRETLSSTKGQEALRADALKTFNGALVEEHTDTKIDDVLFTSFVVQR